MNFARYFKLTTQTSFLPLGFSPYRAQHTSDKAALAYIGGMGSASQQKFVSGQTYRAENINTGMADASRAPAWKSGTTVTDRVVTQPETYRMVVDEATYGKMNAAINIDDNMNAAVGKLGGWATKDPVNSISDMSNNLAVSSEWKNPAKGKLYVVEFEIKPGVGLRDGTVGDMWDNLQQTRLEGGGHQIQFMDKQPYKNPELYKINWNTVKEIK